MPVKPEILESFRTYVAGMKEPGSKDVYILGTVSTRNYSAADILEQMERGTPDGMRLAGLWERAVERKAKLKGI